MRLTTEQYDYRLSHMAPTKGWRYDEQFINSAWRAFMWERERKVLDHILRTHYAGGAIRHLDFACGTGRILGELRERTKHSVGIDVSDGMLQVAGRKAPRAELIRADITKDDVLEDRRFNLITAFRFFPNAQADLRTEAIRALAAHLAPDGLLVFNNHKNHSSLLYFLARMLGKRLRTMTRAEAEVLVGTVGLEIADVFPIGVLPATDKWTFVPGPVHRASDRIADALGIGNILAQNLIYVCSRKSRPRITTRSGDGT